MNSLCKKLAIYAALSLTSCSASQDFLTDSFPKYTGKPLIPRPKQNEINLYVIQNDRPSHVLVGHAELDKENQPTIRTKPMDLRKYAGKNVCIPLEESGLLMVAVGEIDIEGKIKLKPDANLEGDISRIINKEREGIAEKKVVSIDKDGRRVVRLLDKNEYDR